MLILASIVGTIVRRQVNASGGTRRRAALALTSEFSADSTENTQWNAFIRKGRLQAPGFAEVIASLSEFLTAGYRNCS